MSPFLASMHWQPMDVGRVLLASCESSAEAITLAVAFPSAKLFCLHSHSGRSQEVETGSASEPAARSPLPDWPDLIMLMEVHQGQSLDAEQSVGADGWEPVHTELLLAERRSIPKAFDMVVIPAEGR